MARQDFIDDTYDEEEIYAGGSKDAQGHSTNMRTHIPDPWMAAIGELISSPDWPEYKTSQHFIRDAIFHRLHWSLRQGKRKTSERVKRLVALSRLQAETNYRAMEREAFQELITDLRQAFRDAHADGDNMGLRELLKETEAHLDDMPQPYRDQIRDEIISWDRRL